jgi:hypothetical protein
LFRKFEPVWVPSITKEKKKKKGRKEGREEIVKKNFAILLSKNCVLFLFAILITSKTFILDVSSPTEK